MIVCFHCSTETKANLDRLLADGAYQSYDEAIGSAIRNQVLMEQEAAATGAIVISGSTLAPARPQQPLPQPDREPKEKPGMNRSRNGASTKEMSVAARIANPPIPEIPTLFRLDGFPEELPGGLAELPPDMWSHGQTIPLDRWVLGQFNRLLPAKANSRALIRLCLDNPGGLEIAEAASTVAEQAAILGAYLRHLDAKNDIPRDDALSTAFPTTSDDADKSRTRYANQFVAYQNGKGELSGLMIDLKLINVLIQRKERRLVPTRVAWEFAAMPNPLLDGGPDGSLEKFSPQERSFLIGHLVRSVPVEAFAYRVILRAVADGYNTPETIDAVLRSDLISDRVAMLSPSFLASQRSGAISRMSDLGLIARQRAGVRVLYSVGQNGTAFLEMAASVERRAER
jgi:hypothetical protein